MSGLEGLLAGRTLVDRYRIEAVIGRGGFAAVYRADDERLGRAVAVKVITLAAPDEETRENLRQRFQREARSAASLPQHPNVVTVHDFGTDPELGLDFLVMEFLHGEDLATHLARQRKLPLESALRVLRDAVEGVAVGHRSGLIHRDVKPGNIFLAEPHGEDPFRVCVLDFGIAHVRSQDQTSTRLTKTGIPLSPAYCSPEQLRGERDLLAASDVFSLGVVAYQLLTGEKPLRADRTVDPADWAPERAIRDLNPSVPSAVAAVIERAMAYDAGERYQDADALADALDEAVAVAPVGDLAAAPVPIPVPLDDDRTLLQPEPLAPAEATVATPAPPPPPPAAAMPVAAAGPTGKRPAYASWGILVLVAALATIGGLWALTRGGQPDTRPAGEVILQEDGGTAPEVERSGTRVTGQIVEEPIEPLPGATAPSGSFPDQSAPAFPDPGRATAPSRSGDGTIIMPPQQRPIARPPTQPPADTRPSIPNRTPDGVPSAQPAPAAPPAAPRDTSGPPLLGVPAGGNQGGAPGGNQGGGGGGGGAGGGAPRPDTAGAAPAAGA